MNYEVFLSEDAEDDIEELDATQRRKLDWWTARLAEDFSVGDHIRRELIPEKPARKYDLQNLWRITLPRG